jgi:mannose-1-phosphate guanylyltransferase
MRDTGETWAVVLAGGEGSRLRALTTTREGQTIPKQYCSLRRPSCLLQDALERARTAAMSSHVCAVVAAQHRRWWTAALSGLPQANVFVQPEDKGTAYGMLLALLKLEEINPRAPVTFLPADHYFRDEAIITRLLRVAGNLASVNTDATYVLGVEPDAPDPELGYILPASPVGERPVGISGFTEKPSPEYAKDLISLGAVWNLFVFVGTVRALLALFEEDHAEAVRRMREALRQSSGRQDALDAFYQTAAPLDFSHDVLEVQATRLQVLRLPHCGWTDLGSAQRVEAALRSMTTLADARLDAATSPPLFLDLCATR